MRIALDATYSLGEHLSGVGVYSREILNGIAAAHPEAELIFCYRPHRFLRSYSEPLPRNARRFLLQEPLTPRSAAIFHGLNQRLPRAPLPRTVTTFHDLFVITGEYSSPEFRARFEEQARDAAARSDLIVAVSEFTASQVERLLGVERARLRVVHHGVRVAAAETKPRDRIVLHVGAIQTRKNLVRLVRAFGRLGPEWRLVLAGSLGFGADRVLREIESSPRRDSIRVAGYTSASELERLYARAAVFAFPSLDEGFGMPVLEAMAHGIPVVTSNRSALPEVAGDAALLINPEDEDELGSALCEIARDEDLRNRMIERGKFRAAGFTWESAALRTWSVYKELV